MFPGALTQGTLLLVSDYRNSLLRGHATQSQSLTVVLNHPTSRNVTSFVSFGTPLGTVIKRNVLARRFTMRLRENQDNQLRWSHVACEKDCTANEGKNRVSTPRTQMSAFRRRR